MISFPFANFPEHRLHSIATSALHSNHGHIIQSTIFLTKNPACVCALLEWNRLAYLLIPLNGQCEYSSPQKVSGRNKKDKVPGSITEAGQLHGGHVLSPSLSPPTAAKYRRRIADDGGQDADDEGCRPVSGNPH